MTATDMIVNVKMTNLNRQTSPLYKRLDKKIKQSQTKTRKMRDNKKQLKNYQKTQNSQLLILEKKMIL